MPASSAVNLLVGRRAHTESTAGSTPEPFRAQPIQNPQRCRAKRGRVSHGPGCSPLPFPVVFVCFARGLPFRMLPILLYSQDWELRGNVAADPWECAGRSRRARPARRDFPRLGRRMGWS